VQRLAEVQRFRAITTTDHEGQEPRYAVLATVRPPGPGGEELAPAGGWVWSGGPNLAPGLLLGSSVAVAVAVAGRATEGP
jgi:hypothetical protein